MIERFKNYIADLLTRRSMRRTFEPSADAYKRAHAAFLAALAEESPVMYRSYVRHRVAVYVVASVLALLAINGGAVVYADVADVAADSPLYPYKRVSEKVRVAIAPAESKPTLRAHFAERRSREIKRVSASIEATGATTAPTKSTRPAEPIRNELRKVLREEVKEIQESVVRMPETKREEKRAVVCRELEAIEGDVFEDATTSLEVFGRIAEMCDTGADDKKGSRKGEPAGAKGNGLNRKEILERVKVKAELR